MPKVLHVSFLWDDPTVNQRHSDYILAMGWVKAGWDVLYFDYRMTAEEYGNDIMNSALMQIILDKNPDIVFFTKVEGASRRIGKRTQSCCIDPTIIPKLKDKGYKGKFVHWFLDQRYDYFKSTLNIGKHCDWFFYVAAGERLKGYSLAMSTPASWIPAPYEPSFLKPRTFIDRKMDLIWMGGAHKPSRNHFEDTRYSMLQKFTSCGFLRNYYGCFSKSRVWCPQYQKLLGESKMGLSLYAFDRPMYFSNRLSHIMGSGTAIFSYDFKDRKRIFSDTDGIFFKDVADAKKQYQYYMANLDELEWVAQNGYNKVSKYFTSSCVVSEILHTLSTGESSLPFGETHNPWGKKYDVPLVSDKSFGNIHHIDRYGKTFMIEQYGDATKVVSNDSKATIERRKHRAERIKELHSQKANYRLTKRAGNRLVNRRPNIR